MIELKELVPSGSQKSFGGKASIVKSDGVDILYSYNTPIAMIILNFNGRIKFCRLWDGYSSTTMRHINAFRSIYGLDAISKKKWEKMPTNVIECGSVVEEA